MTYVVLTGSIGVGKSTVGRAVAQNLGIPFIQEPIDSNPFLAEFYKDPLRWALANQLHFLTFHFAYQSRTQEPFIIERSILDDASIFSAVCYRRGYLTRSEHNALTRLAEELQSKCVGPKKMIWLKARAPVTSKRVANRSSPSEHDIMEEYLIDLEAEYEAVLSRLNSGVVAIDASAPLEEVVSQATFHVQNAFKS
jgi:deoxyadenosine/deoxycytidine kinase